MAKSWKPKLPKAFQPWKPPKQVDPFKMSKFQDPFKPPKEPKAVVQPHVITFYDREIIRILTPAILEKRLIKFWYEDKTEDKIGWRKIEPHQIGQLRPEKSKEENIILTGWFLPSEEQIWEGWDENWKNYILERISKIEILDETYRLTRMGYNQRDEKRCSIVYCATAERVI